MNKPLRVLIVDDSALVRQALTAVLCQGTSEFEVMASVSDPFAAVRAIRQEVPDVILLDIEMPKMDGVTFLRKLMRQRPIPTIICSSLAAARAPITLAALEAGAVDVIQKPSLSTREFFLEASDQIRELVRVAARANLRKPARPRSSVEKPQLALRHTTDRVVVIGASTGGTEAIATVLAGLDANCPGVAIVQHMPPYFTASFAKRLNDTTPLHVREARSGDAILPGQVLLAPGDHHMELRRSGAHYHVILHQAPPVNRHRPSVDVLFRSAAEHVGANAVAVILTGMGADGADGMKELRDRGARTIAQDERTSIVYGMPYEALKRGGVEQVLALDDIPNTVLQLGQLPVRSGSLKPASNAKFS